MDKSSSSSHRFPIVTNLVSRFLHLWEKEVALNPGSRFAEKQKLFPNSYNPDLQRQALAKSENTRDILAVKHDSKSASLTIARTAAACARDNRYP